MAIYDRWHLSHPPEGSKTCGKHRGKVASAQHGIGLRWQVRGKDDRGRPVRRSFEFEEAAKDFDAELKAAVKAGTYVDDRAGNITFREYAEGWRRTRSHGHATAERLERGLRNNCYSAAGTPGKTPHGRVAIGDYPMSVLSRRVSLIRDWIADLPLQANTALLLIDRVTAIFEAAVDDRIIPRNPVKVKSVDLPEHHRAEVVAWTKEEVSAVAAGLPERLTAMAWLGACTGMRQGELFGVALEDVDFLRRTVRVNTEVLQLSTGLAFGPIKNRNSRTVPVSRHVVPLLSEHVAAFRPVPVTLPWSDRKDKKKDGRPVTRTLLFPDDHNHAWFKQTVNRRWQASWRKAGITDRGRANGMHVLRHTAASTWLSHGLNPAKVAAWLGDTVAIVLKTYAHYLPQDDDLGREIMDRFLAPEGGSGALDGPGNALLAGN